MRTLLSQFCEEFAVSVSPLLDPLRRAAETLAHSAGGGPAVGAGISSGASSCTLPALRKTTAGATPVR